MKNIHILPTDKPSRLIIQNGNRLILGVLDYSIIENRQHIYITSDEEIKKGDWFITTDTNEIHKSDWVKFHFNNGKKIILTTNVGLIKNGVQKIDDEFLEWFVKNPSCEEVKTQLKLPWESSKDEYEIIIPKEKLGGIPKGNITMVIGKSKQEPKKKHIVMLVENKVNDEQTKCYCGHTTYCDCGPEETEQECMITKIMQMDAKMAYDSLPKQHLIDMMKGDEELGLYDEIQPEQIWNEEKKKGIKQLIQDHKKETLEEAGEKNFINIGGVLVLEDDTKSQQSYSEKEVIELLQKALTHQDDGETGSLVTAQGKIRMANFYSWFEQFKKK